MNTAELLNLLPSLNDVPVEIGPDYLKFEHAPDAGLNAALRSYGWTPHRLEEEWIWVPEENKPKPVYELVKPFHLHKLRTTSSQNLGHVSKVIIMPVLEGVAPVTTCGVNFEDYQFFVDSYTNRGTKIHYKLKLCPKVVTRADLTGIEPLLIEVVGRIAGCLIHVELSTDLSALVGIGFTPKTSGDFERVGEGFSVKHPDSLLLSEGSGIQTLTPLDKEEPKFANY